MKSIPFILPLVTVPLSMVHAEKREKAEMPQSPNVIFIYADDIGYGDLSCNGAKTICTPHVERLAAEGVRFTNAIVPRLRVLLPGMRCLPGSMPGAGRERVLPTVMQG